MQRAADQQLTVETSRLTRYNRGIEATVYFVVVEAAERARRSGASFTRATVADDQGWIVIDLATDGVIGREELRLVTDRIEALAGTTALTVTPEGITHLSGRVPGTERELETA